MLLDFLSQYKGQKACAVDSYDACPYMEYAEAGFRTGFYDIVYTSDMNIASKICKREKFFGRQRTRI